jgi:hypothetical protein
MLSFIYGKVADTRDEYRPSDGVDHRLEGNGNHHN